MELRWPLLFFDPARDDARDRQAILGGTAPTHERRLFCAACRHVVTHQDQRIAVHGTHEHSFANPVGLAYRIGCFRDAAGCAAVGTSTKEFTWFRGYAWQIGLCTNCHAHLGWRFQSEQEYFHGLIVERLTSAGHGA